MLDCSRISLLLKSSFIVLVVACCITSLYATPDALHAPTNIAQPQSVGVVDGVDDLGDQQPPSEDLLREDTQSSKAKMTSYENMSDYHDKLIEWIGLMLAGWGIVIAAVVTVAGVVVPFAINHFYSKKTEKRQDETLADFKVKSEESLEKICKEADSLLALTENATYQQRIFELERIGDIKAHGKQIAFYDRIIANDDKIEKYSNKEDVEGWRDVAKHRYNRGAVYLEIYKHLEKSPYIEEIFIKDHLNQGQSKHLEKSQSLALAISDFEKAIELDSNEDEPYYNLGTCYEKLRKYEEALRYYKEAIKREGSRKYYSSQMTVLAELGRFDEAWEVFDKIKRKFDYSIDLRYFKINLLTKQRKLIEARMELTDLLEARTESIALVELDEDHHKVIEVLRDLYFIELKLFCYDGAMDCLNRILTIEPGNYDALVNKGYLLLAIGRCREALELALKAINNKSENYRAYNLQGQIYTKMNDFVAAKESFDKALKCNDQKSDIYHNYGALYEKDRSETRAIYYYSKAIEIAPSTLESRNALARLYLRIEQYDEVIDVLDNIFAIDPNNAKAHMTRVWLLSKKEDYSNEMVLEEYKKLEGRIHYSEAHELYYNMGVLCQIMANYEDALHYLEKSLEYCPYEKRLEIQQHKAYNLFKLGHATQATNILNDIEKDFINENN